MHPGAELEAEHRLLLRRYAALQQRVSAWCDAQQRETQRLQAELLRWRARWVSERTRHAWDLPHAPPWQPAWAQAEAQALLCQTGCLPFGRAGADGDTCRRTQQPCAAPQEAVSAPARPPRPMSRR